MSLTKQPKVFATKFLTNLCLHLQLGHLIPEEMQAFFSGELTFPEEDQCGAEISRLDDMISKLPLLADEEMDNFEA